MIKAMTRWPFLRRLIGRPATMPVGDTRVAVRWIVADASPFGVELLDCSDFAESFLTGTADPGVAVRYSELRSSSGAEYRGRSPEDTVAATSDLRYPPTGDVRDGPTFKAAEMEEKWDIYLYDGFLYFVRSWTGELEYRARILVDPDGASVVAVAARGALFAQDPAYPVAVVDFLVKSHLYQPPAPHPLPRSLGRDPQRLAVFSFSQYGRRARYGRFADTTKLERRSVLG